jgi:hypothetical protein
MVLVPKFQTVIGHKPANPLIRQASVPGGASVTKQFASKMFLLYPDSALANFR